MFRPRPRPRRHTPFMPEDYWRGPPEFGETQRNVSVAVNATAELRCPIGHVQDSAVSHTQFCEHRCATFPSSLTFYFLV